MLFNNFSSAEKNEFAFLIANSQKYLKASINKYLFEIKTFDYKKNILLENLKLSQKKLKIVSNQILIYNDFVVKNILNQNTLFDLQKQQFDLINQITNFNNEIQIIDKQKLLRAGEVFLQTGKKIEFFQQQSPKKILENQQFIHLNLNPSREEIYKNCDERFLKMLQNNVLNEVENYWKNNHDLTSPIVNTLGFKEIINFLDNKISFAEMQKLASQKTRNYAKRQLTWFRHQFDEILFCENQQKILENLKNIDLFICCDSNFWPYLMVPSHNFFSNVYIKNKKLFFI